MGDKNKPNQITNTCANGKATIIDRSWRKSWTERTQKRPGLLWEYFWLAAFCVRKKNVDFRINSSKIISTIKMLKIWNHHYRKNCLLEAMVVEWLYKKSYYQKRGTQSASEIQDVGWAAVCVALLRFSKSGGPWHWEGHLQTIKGKNEELGFIFYYSRFILLDSCSINTFKWLSFKLRRKVPK